MFGFRGCVVRVLRSRVVQVVLMLALLPLWRPTTIRRAHAYDPTDFPSTTELAEYLGDLGSTLDTWVTATTTIVFEMLNARATVVDAELLQVAASCGDLSPIRWRIDEILGDFGWPIPPEPDPVETAPVGTTPGTFSVNASGSATYVVPLELPPGRAGVQPELSLMYDSSRGLGRFGVGWSLAGISKIAPCDATFAQDGVLGSKVGFCLDGQRLIEVGPDEFRTERDSFARITRHPMGTTADFIVETRDGLRHTYPWYPGANYPLARVEDSQGNRMTISHSGDGGRPESIEYTENRAPTGELRAEAATKVLFAYDDAVGQGGGPRRAYRIRIVHESTVPGSSFGGITLPGFTPPRVSFRDYDLTYERDEHGHVARLSQIQECVGSCDGGTCTREGVEADLGDANIPRTCKPPTRFDWQVGRPSTSQPLELPVWTHGSAPGLVLPKRGAVRDLFTEHSWDGTRFETNACGGPFRLDFNGDGRDDVAWAEDCGDSGRWKIMLARSNREGFDPPIETVLPARHDTHPADINRDGRTDLVTTTGGDWRLGVVLPGGDAPRDAQIATLENVAGDRMRNLVLADLNGDGLTDLLSCNAGEHRTVELPAGISLTYTEYWHLYAATGRTQEPFFVEAPGSGQIGCKDAPTALFDDERVGRSDVAVNGGPGYPWLKVLGFEDGLTAVAPPDETWNDAYHTANLIGEGVSFDSTWRLDVNNDGDYDKTFEVESIADASRLVVDFDLDGYLDVVRLDFDAAGAGEVCDENAPGGYECVGAIGRWGWERHWRHGGFSGGYPSTWQGSIGGPSGTSVFGYGVAIPDPSDGSEELYANAPAVAGDFDGDGQTDLLLVSPEGNWVVHYHRRALYPQSGGPFGSGGLGVPDPGLGTPDLIRRITDGRGATTHVQYRPMTDAEVYTPGTGCEGPASCVRTTQALVRKTAEETGTGAYQLTRYSYEDARVDRWSRRSLGFARRTVARTHADGSEYRKVIEQDIHSSTYGDTPDADTGHPLGLRGFLGAGLVDRQTTVVRGKGKTFATVATTDWEWHEGTAAGITGPQLLERTAFPFKKHEAIEHYELPYETWSVSGAAPLRTTSTTRVVDTFGNETRVETVDGDGNGTTVVRIYRNLTGEHWGSRLQTERITDVVDGESATRVSDYQYHDDPERFGLRSRMYRDVGGNSELLVDLTYGPGSFGMPTGMRVVGEGVEPRWSFRAYDRATSSFPTVMTNPEGHVSTVRWNTFLGKPEYVRDPSGVETHIQYDLFGRVVSQRILDRRLQERGTTTHRYEALGPVEEGEPSPLRVTMASKGYADVILDEDVLGRIVREETTVYGGREIYTTRTFDADGRLVTTTRPTNLGEAPLAGDTYEFDAIGRVVQRTAADGQVFRTIHDGLRTTFIEPDGDTRHTDVNQRGLTKRVTNLDAEGDAVVCYEYKGFGILRRTLRNCGTSGDQQPIVVQSDSYGQPYSVTDASVSNTPTTFRYNALGELQEMVDPSARVTTFEYDRIGRPVWREDEDGFTTWVYDVTQTGSLGYSISPWGHTKFYRYGHDGQVTSVQTSVAGAFFYTQRMEYGENGRLEALEYPGTLFSPGLRVNYGYEAATGRNNSVWDDMTGQVYWALNATDESGRTTIESFGNGLQTEREYTPVGLPSRIRTGPIQDLAYFWTPDRNLHARQDNVHEQWEVFGYDDLDRLTSVRAKNASGQERVDTLRYDRAGNPTYISYVGDLVHTVQGAARVTTPQGQYRSDQNGNVTLAPGGLQIDYTMFDKPSRMLVPNDQIDFEYDAGGNRLVRTAQDADTTTLTIDGLYEVTWPTSSGLFSQDAEHRFFVRAEGRVVAQVTRTQVDPFGFFGTGPGASYSTDTYYVHEDHLGSSNVVTDEGGEVVHRAEYTAFGLGRGPDWVMDGPDVTIGLEPSPVSVGFTGHREQRDFGLIDMGGRLYFPKIARFNAADPVSVGDDLQALNRFAYVRNNPLTLTDPSGYYSEGWPGYGPWVDKPDGMFGGGWDRGQQVVAAGWMLGSFFHAIADWFQSLNGGGGGGGGNGGGGAGGGEYVDPQQAQYAEQYANQTSAAERAEERYRESVKRNRVFQISDHRAAGNSGSNDGTMPAISRPEQIAWAAAGAATGVGGAYGVAYAIGAACATGVGCPIAIGVAVAMGGYGLWDLANGGWRDVRDGFVALWNGTASAEQAFGSGLTSSAVVGAGVFRQGVAAGAKATARGMAARASAARGAPKALPAPRTRGNPNPIGERGTFYVDSKGNVIPTPPGGRITGSPDGRFIQARDAAGNPTGVRIDGPHRPATHPDPRAQQPHGHVPGVTNPDGTPWLPINQ